MRFYGNIGIAHHTLSKSIPALITHERLASKNLAPQCADIHRLAALGRLLGGDADQHGFDAFAQASCSGLPGIDRNAEGTVPELGCGVAVAAVVAGGIVGDIDLFTL